MSVYRESDGDKRFYFSGYYIDPGDPNSHIDTHILFNKQFPGGGWQYSTSRVVYTELNSSIALGFEVTASSAVFRNPSNGLFYPRIMYVVKQPQACNGIVAGFLYVMFGSSDLSWTAPQKVSYTGMPYFSCLDQADEAGDGRGVPVEAVGGFFDGTTLVLVGLEGNIAQLSPNDTSGHTLTYLAYTASLSSPTTITIQGGISALGMFNPNVSGYTLHRYWINLSLAYDQATSTIYMTRVYPYPYDPNYPGIVSACTSCVPGIDVAALPNRGQIYKMPIAGNYLNLRTGTWQLVADWGQNQGYNRLSGSTCVATSLVSGQTNIGIDVDAISLLRTPTGGLSSSRQAYIARKGRFTSSCPDNMKSVYVQGF